jgi:hypothetical protein
MSVKKAHLDLLKGCAKKLETTLSEPDSDQKVAQVTCLLKVLATQWIDYEGAALNVQASIPDDEIESRLTEELKEFGDTRACFLTTETQGNLYLASKSVNRDPPRRPTSPVRAPKVKLPELKIPVFDGNVVDWPAFWSSFSVIHDHSELTPEVKMMHLTNYIKGDAARTIQGLHVSAGNYDSAVRMLTDRFNRSDLIIASHLKSLRNLPMVKASQDFAGLRHLFTEIDVHTRGLSEQGQNSTTYGVFLATMLFEKFPQDLQLEWISNARNKITDFDGLVLFLKKAVEARERCNSYAPSVSSTAAQPEAQTAARRLNEFRKPAVATAAGLVSTVQARVCIFCNASHSNFNCPLAVNEKRRLVNVKRLCLNCLSSQHVVQACPSHHSCRVCRRAHHTSLHQDEAQQQQQQKTVRFAPHSSGQQQQQRPQQHPANQGAIPRVSSQQQQGSSRPSASDSQVVASVGTVVPST